MATVQDVLDRIKRFFPNVPEAIRLEFLQSVHTELLASHDLAGTTAVNTSLTTTDWEYALPSMTLKVWDVKYYTDADTYYDLEEVSWDYLQEEEPYWQQLDTGVPKRFYTRHNNIGLDVRSQEASSGSPAYPRLEYDYSVYETLSVSTDMPSSVPDHEAWVYKTCVELAIYKEDSRLPYLAKVADMKEDALRFYINIKNARQDQVMIPPGTSRVRRV